MVKEIRIYIEGGGDNQAGRAAIRTGFGEFLSSVQKQARSKGVKWSIILCGSRNNTFDDFKTALKTRPEAFNVLLVDSEEAVHTAPWQHLAQRQGDGWTKPDGEPGKYHKIHHAPKLLALINAERVCSVAPHCTRLFSTLSKKINNE